MLSRADVVAEARRWIGTPFMHQQHMRGVGADCAGLVRGVCMALGIFPADLAKMPDSWRYLGYSRQPDGVLFRQACETYMTPIAISAAQAGDVIAMRFLEHPQHCAIVSDYQHGGLAMIHALNHSNGTGRVVEHRIDPTWRKRIVGAYRLPGVD